MSRLCLSIATFVQNAQKNQPNVAVKESFISEVEALQQVAHHCNIINLYDAFEDAKYFYLEMESVYGGDLFSFVPFLARLNRFTFLICLIQKSKLFAVGLLLSRGQKWSFSDCLMLCVQCMIATTCIAT